MQIKMMLLAAVAVGSISTADAETYRVTYNGTAATPTGIINGVNPAPVTSSIKAGDAFTATVEYDISKAVVTSTFDADPTVNIYYMPISYSYSVGSYSTGPQTNINSGSIQIWNGHKVTDSLSNVDAYSLSGLFRYIPASTSPIALGDGQISANLSLNAFDFTGTKLNSDLIQGLPNFDEWSLSMDLGFLNSTTGDFGYVRGENVTATITQIDAGAVPEPATWAMMILGMGAVGYATRRRQKVRVAFA